MAFIRFAAAVALLGMAACTPPQVWTKPGASDAEFRMTSARCEYEAEAMTPSFPVFGGYNAALAQGRSEGIRVANLRQLCMRAHGWNLAAAQRSDNYRNSFTGERQTFATGTMVCSYGPGGRETCTQ